jgi:hypothetical protein
MLKRGVHLLFTLSAALTWDSSSGLAQSDDLFLLKVAPVARKLTVWVGNSTPLEFLNLERIRLQDITPYLKPGNNTLRLNWQGLNSNGDVSLRTQSGEVLFNYVLDETRQPTNGTVRFTIFLEGKQKILAARSSATLSLGEALLNVNLSSGLLTLTLNGQYMGDYAGTTNRVLQNLKRGTNVLKVRWSKDFGVSLPLGALELQNNDNNQILVWDTDKVRSLEGEETVTFKYP